jgi:hypothetical protein
MRSEKERLMEEALAIINGSRREDYGPPERNFERIALLHTAYLRARGLLRSTDAITSVDVCRMQGLVKVCRRMETPNHEDSLRDDLGYTLLEIEMVLEQPEKEDVVRVDWPATPDDEISRRQAEHRADYLARQQAAE